MSKNTSVSISPHFDSFIQAQIEAGLYTTTSEVIRAGLRLLEQEQKKLELLKQALIDGEESGFVEDFNPQVFLAELKQQS